MKLRDRNGGKALVAVPEAKSRLITVVKQREIVAFPFSIRRSCFDHVAMYVRLILGNLPRLGIFAFEASISDRRQIRGKVNNNFVIILACRKSY